MPPIRPEPPWLPVDDPERKPRRSESLYRTLQRARSRMCFGSISNKKTVEQIVNELLEIRGDKDFRDTIERLVDALRMTGPADLAISAKSFSGLARSPRAIKMISSTSTRRSPRSISETKLWVLPTLSPAWIWVGSVARGAVLNHAPTGGYSSARSPQARCSRQI